MIYEKIKLWRLLAVVVTIKIASVLSTEFDCISMNPINQNYQPSEQTGGYELAVGNDNDNNGIRQVIVTGSGIRAVIIEARPTGSNHPMGEWLSFENANGQILPCNGVKASVATISAPFVAPVVATIKLPVSPVNSIYISASVLTEESTLLNLGPTLVYVRENKEEADDDGSADSEEGETPVRIDNERPAQPNENQSKEGSRPTDESAADAERQSRLEYDESIKHDMEGPSEEAAARQEAEASAAYEAERQRLLDEEIQQGQIAMKLQQLEIEMRELEIKNEQIQYETMKAEEEKEAQRRIEWERMDKEMHDKHKKHEKKQEKEVEIHHQNEIIDDEMPVASASTVVFGFLTIVGGYFLVNIFA